MYSLIITYCLFGQLCFVEPVEGDFLSLERCFNIGAIETGRKKVDTAMFGAKYTYNVQCTDNFSQEIEIVQW